jgi:uncharacterized glyoxalase superfamily protein PhnB
VTNDRPVFDQVNLVVRDMAKSVAFYEQLGVEVGAYDALWDRHHRNVSTRDGIDLDLDSAGFAAMWDQGWPAGAVGAVFTFRFGSRDAVDAKYEELTAAGYAGQQPPYDAFWGARFAVVTDPDGNAVGLMSESVDAFRSEAPDVSHL